MALNKKIGVVIFDKQTAFGVAAATKRFGLGLRGGSVLQMGMEQAHEELTVATRFPPSAYRSAFAPMVDFTTRAWPKSIVALLELALGTRVTTGAADPFTHTMTAATNPPYFTAFTRLDTEYHTIRDNRIDELSFTWDQAQPVEVGVKSQGVLWTGYTTSHTPTIDDSDQQSFFPAGGTFQIDSDSVTPVTADITGGSIVINNGLQPVRASRSTSPIDVWPGAHIITVTLRVIPADTTLWRSVITASDAGTAVSNAPVYGSFNTLFVITASTRQLQLTAPRIAFTGEYPEPDPAGGPVEIELVGTVVKPAGEPFTAVVQNDQAATTYAGS